MLIILFGISIILTKNPLYSVGCLILVFLCVSIHLAYIGLMYISLTYLIVVRCCGLCLVDSIWLGTFVKMNEPSIGELGNAQNFLKSSCLPDAEMARGQEHAGKVGEGRGYQLLQDNVSMVERPNFTGEIDTTITHHGYDASLSDSVEWSDNWAYAYELNESLESQPKETQTKHITTTGSPKGSNSYGDGVVILGTVKSFKTDTKGPQNIRTYSTKAASKQISAFESGMEWLSQMKKNNDGRYYHLYKLISSKELLAAAYNEIKSNPGNITPGTDQTTLDHFSPKTIEQLEKSLKEESFRFTSVKRVYIPKKNGKIRPLGIPNVKDKVVQKAISMLLTVIYEPIFSDRSHGFRHNRSTHSALRDISHWNGTAWVIEGDIKGFFDNINHKKLVDIISMKIADQQFIDLLWKLLRAGYLENGSFKPSTLGVPQGGIISPILSNIYLDVFDKYMEIRIAELSSQEKLISNNNPIIAKFTSELTRLNEAYKESKSPEILKEMKTLRAQRNKQPSRVRVGIRLHYVRYADDWVVGIIGAHSLALKLKMEIKEFLFDELSLELSDEKTLITHLPTSKAKFLGVEFFILRRSNSPLMVRKLSAQGKIIYSRINNVRIHFHLPYKSILNTIIEKGFIKEKIVNGKKVYIPFAITKWIFLDHRSIIIKYKSVIQGLFNYYHFVDNIARFWNIQYFFQHSCAKTIARKYRLRSRAAAFKKFGKYLTAPVPEARNSQ